MSNIFGEQSLAAAKNIEQHRHSSGGLIAGDVLKTYRKWAFNERSRIGEDYAAILIMTGYVAKTSTKFCQSAVLIKKEFKCHFRDTSDWLT